MSIVGKLDHGTAVQGVRLNARSIAIDLHIPLARYRAARIAAAGGTGAYACVNPYRLGSALDPFASRCPFGMTIASTFVFLVAIGVPLALAFRCPLTL